MTKQAKRIACAVHHQAQAAKHASRMRTARYLAKVGTGGMRTVYLHDYALHANHAAFHARQARLYMGL